MCKNDIDKICIKKYNQDTRNRTYVRVGELKKERRVFDGASQCEMWNTASY